MISKILTHLVWALLFFLDRFPFKFLPFQPTIVLGGESSVIRGIYTGATGMITQQRRLDVISNNLANVNTPGFKRDFLADTAYPEAPMYRVAQGGASFIGTLGFGVGTPTVHTDFTQGSLRTTDNPLDVALIGEGYFVVDGAQGERYTRSGHFFRDAEGYLVTSAGEYVQGVEGPINIAGSSVEITGDGTVMVDGQAVDRLRVVWFPPGTGAKLGETLWVAAEVFEVEQFHIQQGAVEASNVNSVKEMVDMINVLRAYEANQRVITSEDQLLEKAVNEIGRT